MSENISKNEMKSQSVSPQAAEAAERIADVIMPYVTVIHWPPDFAKIIDAEFAGERQRGCRWERALQEIVAYDSCGDTCAVDMQEIAELALSPGAEEE